MDGSSSAITTFGFGSWGSVNLIPTMGFGTGTQGPVFFVAFQANASWIYSSESVTSDVLIADVFSGDIENQVTLAAIIPNAEVSPASISESELSSGLTTGG